MSESENNMVVRHEDLIIAPQNPYSDDKLGRKQYGEALEQIISTFDNGCVIALNGDWGTGKTTFAKMWRQQLEDNSYKTIYFNAWETDYIEDPVIALIAEFKKLSSDKLQETTQKVLKTFSKVSLAMVPTILSLIAKYSLGIDVEKITKEGADALANVLDQNIDKYIEQKKSIEEFKNALTEYVSIITPDKPLVFIVDELDRCNPKYAVKVLERIKHLFSVSNVVFVLSIDKKHLCHSICGFYGNNNIDAENYLRRFIDLELNLPQASIESFCKYLYEYYSFNSFFENSQRPREFTQHNEVETFIEMSINISKHSNLSLRNIDRIFSNTRIALRMFSVRGYVRGDLLFLLTYLHLCHSDVYDKMCRKVYSIQDLIDAFIKIFPLNLITYSRKNHAFYLIIGMLLVDYNMDEGGEKREILYSYDQETRECALLFDSKLFDKTKLAETIKKWDDYFGYMPTIKEYADKINLLSNLRSQ